MRFAILGSGAVGGEFAAKLARAGQDDAAAVAAKEGGVELVDEQEFRDTVDVVVARLQEEIEQLVELLA